MRSSLAALGSTSAVPPKKGASFFAPWHGVPLATARRFYQRCMAEVAEAVSQADLTTLQFAALLYLTKQPDPRGMEQNKLAAGMDVDRNSASLLVEQLVTRGLVERRVSDADRRIRLLSLTPRGKKLVARIEPSHLAATERILAPLTKNERELLFSLLIRVIEAKGSAPSRVSRNRRNSR